MINRNVAKWRGVIGIVLVTAALFALARAYPTFPGDERALLQLQAFQTGWLDGAALAVSRLGWLPVSAALVAGVCAGLFMLGRRWDALVVMLTPAPIFAGIALKEVVERPRPEYLLAGPASDGLSFPSGHALFAFIVGGILILVVEDVVKPLLIRRSLQVALALLILAVGASRVYLGAHWPSDVIGGYFFGGAGLLALLMLRNLVAVPRQDRSGAKQFG